MSGTVGSKNSWNDCIDPLGIIAGIVKPTNENVFLLTHF